VAASSSSVNSSTRGRTDSNSSDIDGATTTHTTGRSTDRTTTTVNTNATSTTATTASRNSSFDAGASASRRFSHRSQHIHLYEDESFEELADQDHDQDHDNATDRADDDSNAGCGVVCAPSSSSVENSPTIDHNHDAVGGGLLSNPRTHSDTSNDSSPIIVMARHVQATSTNINHSYSPVSSSNDGPKATSSTNAVSTPAVDRSTSGASSNYSTNVKKNNSNPLDAGIEEVWGQLHRSLSHRSMSETEIKAALLNNGAGDSSKQNDAGNTNHGDIDIIASGRTVDNDGIVYCSDVEKSYRDDYEYSMDFETSGLIMGPNTGISSPEQDLYSDEEIHSYFNNSTDSPVNVDYDSMNKKNMDKNMNNVSDLGIQEDEELLHHLQHHTVYGNGVDDYDNNDHAYHSDVESVVSTSSCHAHESINRKH
jgi:hypothetical protein